MEIWKSVPEWKSLYEVSNLGRCRSKESRRGGKGSNHILKPKRMKDGYLMFRLSFEGKQYYKNAHRLVAEVFLKNPEGKAQVNHKDGNRSNNAVSNLQWCTPRENMQHAIQVLHNGQHWGGGGRRRNGEPSLFIKYANYMDWPVTPEMSNKSNLTNLRTYGKFYRMFFLAKKRGQIPSELLV